MIRYFPRAQVVAISLYYIHAVRSTVPIALQLMAVESHRNTTASWNTPK